MSEPISSRDLAAFIAAVESGSVQGAAEALDLTQSAATKRIQALERTLGARLLIRGRSGVTPTAEGSALYPEGRRALDALSSAQHAVAADARTRPLRISASHTVGECLLPRWLSEFRTTCPNARPHVEIVNSPAVIEAIRRGESEVGFVEGNDSIDEFDTQRVAHDEIVLTVGAEHQWANRDSVPPEELSGERYVSRESGSGTRAVAETKLLRDAGVALEPELSLASLDAVKRSLALGGFSVISRYALEPELSAGALVAVPIDGLEITRDLTAIRSGDSEPGEAGVRLWSWLSSKT